MGLQPKERSSGQSLLPLLRDSALRDPQTRCDFWPQTAFCTHMLGQFPTSATLHLRCPLPGRPMNPTSPDPFGMSPPLCTDAQHLGHSLLQPSAPSGRCSVGPSQPMPTEGSEGRDNTLCLSASRALSRRSINVYGRNICVINSSEEIIDCGAQV